MLTLIYCPFPSIEAARQAAMGLLEARLVACCNLIGPSEALYWWEGKLAANPETILIAKTTTELSEDARAHLAAAHPYKTPAILTFPANANPAFAAWVSTATSENTPA